MCFHAQLEMTAGTDAIALLVSATSKGQAGRQAGRLKDQLRQVQPYIGNEMSTLLPVYAKPAVLSAAAGAVSFGIQLKSMKLTAA